MKIKQIQLFFKNTLRKVMAIPLADKINSFIAILTLISVVCTLYTLKEMQIDRDMAYRPTLSTNPISLSFSWDGNGFDNWTIVPETNSMQDTEEITNSEKGIWGMGGNFTFANIGVGVAKEIQFVWDSGNTERLIAKLVELDRSKRNFCEVGNNVELFYEDHKLTLSKETEYVLMHLLPESTENCKLAIPIHYILIINEIVKLPKYSEDAMFFLNVQYKDIQGKQYSEQFAFQVRRHLLSMGENGSGEVYYQLVPCLSN